MVGPRNEPPAGVKKVFQRTITRTFSEGKLEEAGRHLHIILMRSQRKKPRAASARQLVGDSVGENEWKDGRHSWREGDCCGASILSACQWSGRGSTFHSPATHQLYMAQDLCQGGMDTVTETRGENKWELYMRRLRLSAGGWGY